MHEMGTVMFVVKTVEEVVQDNNLSKVRSVTLEIGEVSGILPEFITTCWDFAIRKSEHLQDAKLIVNTLPAVTYCEECGETYPTVEYGKVCPHCGSGRTYLMKGNEYNIKEIEAC